MVRVSIPAPLYVFAVLLAGWGFVVAGWLSPEIAPLLWVFGLIAVAVLTFPLGFAGFLIGLAAGFAGYISEPETLILLTVLCAGLGYLQWYRLLPAVFGRKEAR